jgi:hypothetical protein
LQPNYWERDLSDEGFPDEGIRALEAQGGIPLEQARKRFLD